MHDEIDDIGLYEGIKCPNCGRTIFLIIKVYQLPNRKKRIKGLIEDILTTQEYEKFKELETLDKIIFGIGKFYDIYRRWPSEKELSDFIGLTKQTISKYLNNTTLIVSKTQKRGLDGRFMEKELLLSDEGKARYSKLIYKVIGYA